MQKRSKKLEVKQKNKKLVGTEKKKKSKKTGGKLDCLEGKPN